MQEFFIQNPHLIFYAVLACSVVIIRLPLIGKYFRTVNTMLHESGHAIAAILTSGEVLNIELSSDTSGTAHTKSSSGIRAIIVSFSGYPFAALLSGLLLGITVSGNTKVVFYLLLSIALINLTFFVRNLYGIVWLLTFSSLILLVFWVGNYKLSYFFALTVSMISLSESVISTLIIFYLSIRYPRKAGDAANLAKVSKIPAAIWGVLLIGLVVVMVYYTIINFFPYPMKPIN